MFAVSYVIIFAFHPNLDINRVIIERSFKLSLHTNNLISKIIKRYYNYKVARSLLLTKKVKLQFAANCLLKWFNKKFKSNNLESSNDVKKKT